MYRLLVALLAVTLTNPAWALRLCIEDADNAPFIIASGGYEQPGTLVEMAQLAAEQQGQVVQLMDHPWKRCIDKVSKGEADAIMAAIWTPERESWGAYPKHANDPKGPPDRQLRIWRAQYPVFVPLHSQLGYDGKTFSHLKTGIGAPPGYVTWQKLKDDGVLSDQVLLPKVGLRLVALNRLDGYVVERNIGRYHLLTSGHFEQVKTLPTLFQEDDWYLVFSKQYQAANGPLVQRIWQALGQIREQQGEAILSRYWATVQAAPDSTR